MTVKYSDKAISRLHFYRDGWSRLFWFLSRRWLSFILMRFDGGNWFLQTVWLMPCYFQKTSGKWTRQGPVFNNRVITSTPVPRCRFNASSSLLFRFSGEPADSRGWDRKAHKAAEGSRGRREEEVTRPPHRPENYLRTSVCFCFFTHMKNELNV